MDVALAITTGCVCAAAFKSMLRRSFLRVVIGFMLISNAINLLILIVGRLTRGEPPLVPHHHKILEHAANPLPQALILTAIVISFGVTAFAFALSYRVYRSTETLNTDVLDQVERDACMSFPQDSDTDAEDGGRYLPA